MNAADTAYEAAHKAREARRVASRLARETALHGSASLRLTLEENWGPIRLWQKGLRNHGVYERTEPEGVVRND